MITPPPTPPALIATWTPATCAWSASILTLDAQVDTVDAQANDFGASAYYTALAARWQLAVAAIRARCASGVAFPPAVCAIAHWFRVERATHMHWVWAARHGLGLLGIPPREVQGLASENAQWAGFYGRLLDLWAVAC